MNEQRYPLCQGPDPNPLPVVFDLPGGAVDCHAHIFGPVERYPLSPARGYTPPEASLDSYLALHKALGGVERAVLTQPSVYGTDNDCMMDAVGAAGKNFRAIVAVGPDITDRELEDLHARGARGVRVNLADKGGNPFADVRSVQTFTERLKAIGWHLEVLIRVHEFDGLFDAMSKMAVPVSFGHLGYMRTDHGVAQAGFQDLLALLKEGRCWVKLTGTYRIATTPGPPYADIRPQAEALIRANEDQLVWGTDWPHPTFSGLMPNDGPLFDQLALWASDSALRKKILVSNPESLYGFDSL
ncbi:MAG: amidohydrolase family protein [Pseudomonadota bacterium]